MSAIWAQERLGHLLAPIDRAEPVDPSRIYRLLGARWYAQGLFVKDEKSGHNIKANTLYRVKAGDFVYNRLFAWKGSFAIADDDANDCHVSNEFPCFAVNRERLDSSYLKWWFSRESAWLRALGLSSGATPTSRNRLKEAHLLGMEIPLPPLDEQRRIVARIEELADKAGEARELCLAASSEAEALARSATDTIYRRLKREFGVRRLDTSCTSITDGDHQTPPFSEGGVKFIFVGNVSTGYLHFGGVKHVTSDYFQRLSASRVPRRGDILYSAVGATLGIPAVVDVDVDFCFQRHVAILKPDCNVALPRFLWHMLRATTVFEKAWASTTGSAQPTIPLRAIRELPIPLPPLDRQTTIVAELDALQAKLDAVKALQAGTAAELDAMLPAILDRAFKGEL